MNGSRADRGQNQSFIVPSPRDEGKFFCGACRSRQIGVVIYVKDGRYVVRLYCTRCGSFDDKVGLVDTVLEAEEV